MSRPIAKGALVDVDPQQRTGRQNSEGGRGLVIKKKRRKVNDDGAEVILTQHSTISTGGESIFDIRYLVGGNLSQNVARERIDVAMIGTTARRVSSDAGSRCPSILSTEHRPHVPTFAVAPTTSPRRYSMPWLLTLVGKKSKRRDGTWAIELFDVLHRKLKDTKGWLRAMETGCQGHLSTDERRQAMDIYLPIATEENADKVVGHAWGVARQTIKAIYKQYIKNGDTHRAKRSDAGATIFNSDAKRVAIYTPSFVFAKQLRQKHADTSFTGAQIAEAWKNADESTKANCAHIAQEWVTQGPFLIAEVTKALSKTKGSVSWDTVATLVAGSGNLQPISRETIRTFVMSLPDSAYKSTKILPKLDAANKLRRLWWSYQFWIFWESAVAFNQGVQVVLAQMDEKWFWAIVTRQNLKSVPFLGIEPVIHGVQHKSHLQKTMGIASTAFVPKGNDMAAGGEAHLLSFVRVGRMVHAKKSSYRRVYQNDGTYHYPKLHANQLRVKGELYFKNMEIVGSDKGKGEPKFALLDFFHDTEIPALEQLCARVATSTGKKVVVRYQMDGAGPHTDGDLQKFLHDSFHDRGWMLVPQPSNSPVTNVHDDCVFPKMSKDVSKEQGITHGSLVMQPDDIWAAAMKCWKAFPLDILARAYVRHGQIVSAIASCNGSDDFIREKGGLHMNVRKCCATVCDNDGKPNGVEVLTAFDPECEEDEIETLRYPRPDVEFALEANLRRMTQTEINLLFNQLPSDHPWFDAVCAVWTDLEMEEWTDDDASLVTRVGGRMVPV